MKGIEQGWGEETRLMGNLSREEAEQGREVTRCWRNGVDAGPSATKGINFSFTDVLHITPFNPTEFT